MNPIQELFDNMTDEELVVGIREIIEDTPLGIYRTNGLVRRLAKSIGEIGATTTSANLFYAEINICKQAAIRWANEKV